MMLSVKVRAKPRIVVVFNRDFEGAEADPENKAREDIRDIAENIVRILDGAGYDSSDLGITGDICRALAVWLGWTWLGHTWSTDPGKGSCSMT